MNLVLTLIIYIVVIYIAGAVFGSMFSSITVRNHWYFILPFSAFGIYLLGFNSYRTSVSCDKGSDECLLERAFLLKESERVQWFFSEIASVNIDKNLQDEPEEKTFCPILKLKDGQWIMLRESYASDFHVQESLVNTFNVFLSDAEQQTFFDEKLNYREIFFGAVLQLVTFWWFVFPPQRRKGSG